MHTGLKALEKVSAKIIFKNGKALKTIPIFYNFFTLPPYLFI